MIVRQKVPHSTRSRLALCGLAVLPFAASYTKPLVGSTVSPYRATAFDGLIVIWLVHLLVSAGVRRGSPLSLRIRVWAPTFTLLAFLAILATFREAALLSALPYAGGVLVGGMVLAVVLTVSRPDGRFQRPRDAYRVLRNGWLIAAVLQAVAALSGLGGAARSSGLFRFPNELAIFGFCTVVIALAPDPPVSYTHLTLPTNREV